MTTHLSRVRVAKSEGINDTIMPNTTQLMYGIYGIRAVDGKRVAANTIEAVRK
jgi:large subunit ribosomal protein L16